MEEQGTIIIGQLQSWLCQNMNELIAIEKLANDTRLYQHYKNVCMRELKE